jgi:DNA modification methylase
VMEGLRQLPDESVHCVVTSPPYWGLRDYGVAGQIGLEPTLAEHIRRLVEVFREVRRVLRSDGVLWLNYGDCFATSPNGRSAADAKAAGNDDRTFRDKPFSTIGGVLKPKDLCMIPHRLAIALQEDGWWVRMDVVWSKPNPMPESIQDRPTKSHEYVFLLTKAERYYYDAEAIKEAASFGAPNAPDAIASPYGQGFTRRAVATKKGARPPNTAPQSGMTRQWKAGKNKSQPDAGRAGFNAQWDEAEDNGSAPLLRNKRSVWTIATAPFPEAHFATFPPELPEICIKAGSSQHGCCRDCGAPWERDTESEFIPQPDVSPEKGVRGAFNQKPLDPSNGNQGYPRGLNKTTTTGWSPTCKCNVGVVPCTVLDPFSGAGTTALVADRLQRRGVGIELNPEYSAIAERRLDKDRGALLDLMEAAE